MNDVFNLGLDDWRRPATAAQRETATEVLEQGGVLYLPGLAFALDPAESGLLEPEFSDGAKNVSLSADGRSLRGAEGQATELHRLQAMMQRFADGSRALFASLLPPYAAALQSGRTSFRPVEIAGRHSSWRKDDTRLHVDAFPSSPTGGGRIVRVFSNVNRRGRARVWRLGEPFEQVARRFAPGLRSPLWGSSTVLRALGITKRRRSPYDHYMLALHDAMKADLAYQAGAAQTVHEFAPGSTWIVFTDQTSHAAMSGQHALEQTFYVPVAAMAMPARAPLSVLERLLRRSLR